MSATRVELIAVLGVPEVQPGDDVSQLIGTAIEAQGECMTSGDVLVVTHKIVSKAEGRVAHYTSEADYRQLVLNEASAIIRRRGDLIIAQTKHGFICANAGVDRSNVKGHNAVALLPDRPDRSAATIRNKLQHRWNVEIAVVVTDTFGRPWRRGVTDVAIGVAGIAPIADLRGTPDMHGTVLDVTEVAIVDEIASAADLVMGKSAGIPAAVVRGLVWTPSRGRATDLVRPAAEDLFR